MLWLRYHTLESAIIDIIAFVIGVLVALEIERYNKID